MFSNPTRSDESAASAELDLIAELAAHSCGMTFGFIGLADDGDEWNLHGDGLSCMTASAMFRFTQNVVAQKQRSGEVVDASARLDSDVAASTTDADDLETCAGVALRTPDGRAVGALCVMGHTPRCLDDVQRGNLIRLAHLAERVADLTTSLRKHKQAAALADLGEQQYRFLTENLADVVVVHDHNLQMQYISPNAPDVIGYDLSEIAAMDRQLPLVSTDERAKLFAQVSTLSEQQPIVYVETKIVLHDGTLRDIAGNTKAIYEDGVVSAYHSSYRDNTEIKRYRDELEAANASLASVAESQHMLIRSIGHDLSAPLAAIRIAVESMNARLDTPSLVEQGQQLERNALQAEALVGDLLRVTDPTGSSGGLVKRIVDLAPVITDCVDGVATYTQIGMNVESVDAEVDPDAIARIVHNLVTNAVRHTPARTPVTVSLRPDGEYVVITVEDLGGGIDGTSRARVINPYQTTDDPDRAGSGLGLTIADLLIRAHHGHLTIGSNDPRGTLVTVRLPRRDPASGE